MANVFLRGTSTASQLTLHDSTTQSGSGSVISGVATISATLTGALVAGVLVLAATSATATTTLLTDASVVRGNSIEITASGGQLTAATHTAGATLDVNVLTALSIEPTTDTQSTATVDAITNILSSAEVSRAFTVSYDFTTTLLVEPTIITSTECIVAAAANLSTSAATTSSSVYSADIGSVLQIIPKMVYGFESSLVSIADTQLIPKTIRESQVSVAATTSMSSTASNTSAGSYIGTNTTELVSDPVLGKVADYTDATTSIVSINPTITVSGHSSLDTVMVVATTPTLVSATGADLQIGSIILASTITEGSKLGASVLSVTSLLGAVASVTTDSSIDSFIEASIVAEPHVLRLGSTNLDTVSVGATTSGKIASTILDVTASILMQPVNTEITHNSEATLLSSSNITIITSSVSEVLGSATIASNTEATYTAAKQSESGTDMLAAFTVNIDGSVSKTASAGLYSQTNMLTTAAVTIDTEATNLLNTTELVVDNVRIVETGVVFTTTTTTLCDAVTTYGADVHPKSNTVLLADASVNGAIHFNGAATTTVDVSTAVDSVYLGSCTVSVNTTLYTYGDTHAISSELVVNSPITLLLSDVSPYTLLGIHTSTITTVLNRDSKLNGA